MENNRDSCDRVSRWLRQNRRAYCDDAEQRGLSRREESEPSDQGGLLGALLAWSTFGSPIVWSIGMVAGGITLTFIGVQLDIVG